MDGCVLIITVDGFSKAEFRHINSSSVCLCFTIYLRITIVSNEYLVHESIHEALLRIIKNDF